MTDVHMGFRQFARQTIGSRIWFTGRGGAPLVRVPKPIRDVIQSCSATEQDNGQLQVRSVLSPEGSHGSHLDHAGADGVNFLQIVRNVKQGEFKFRLEPHDFAG